jgi:glycolate oxidase iron-sulfur subunit
LDRLEETTQAIEQGRVSALDIPELYRCVHCGLCLDACPTYRALHLESESPRGRIHLVRAAAEGRIEINEIFAAHLNLCLMCRACESACPSGVQYGRIAETARALLGPSGSGLFRALTQFSLIRVLPSPVRLRTFARLIRFYQRSGIERLLGKFLPRRLREMGALLPPIPGKFFSPPTEAAPAIGRTRARVGFLSGCVMSILFPEVNEATVNVLRHNGCEVAIPRAQICCGALNVHNGETAAAKRMARRNIDAFLDLNLDAVIVNAAGCGAAMKEYGYLLRDDPVYGEKAAKFSRLVKDASEFLVALGPVTALHPIRMTVTYQDPCHLLHGQRVGLQPRELLKAIPGIEFTEMHGADRCCGSAGIYNLAHPEMARGLLDEKMAAVARTGAQAVVAPNPGCMLQLRYGAKRCGFSVQVFHLMELLQQAYNAGDFSKR